MMMAGPASGNMGALASELIGIEGIGWVRCE